MRRLFIDRPLGGEPFEPVDLTTPAAAQAYAEQLAAERTPRPYTLDFTARPPAEPEQRPRWFEQDPPAGFHVTRMPARPARRRLTDLD
jgi:hypothetical protein